MRNLLLLSFAAALVPAGSALAAEQTVNVGVGGLTCPSCTYIVAQSMQRLPSVEIVDFQPGETFGKGVFVVTFDDANTSEDKIIDAIQMNGYPARILPADNS